MKNTFSKRVSWTVAIGLLAQWTLLVATGHADEFDTHVESVDQDKDGRPEKVREVTSRSGENVMQVIKRDTDGDGHLDRTMKTIFASGSRVFSEVSTGDGLRFRSYGRPGHLAMIELDEDQDGVFETVILYGDGKEVAAVLVRTDDGEVVPAPLETLGKVQASRAIFDQTVRPIMEEMIEETKEGLKAGPD